MISFKAAIDAFSGKRILVVGDVMLDKFIYGDVSRISPEAPAPVIRVRRTEEVLGGAGNVARNIASLGAFCDLVAVVGQDEAAATIRKSLNTLERIAAHFVAAQTRTTTVKTQFVATMHNTHLLRADWEDAQPIDSELETRLLVQVNERLARADAVILSDYNKGTLTPRLLSTIIEAARAQGKSVIVDPKGFNYEHYRHVTALTPNVQELGQAIGRPVADEDAAITTAAAALLDIAGCEAVLVTRGERGMSVVGRDGTAISFAAAAQRVIDVSGAGDTAVASFALALLADTGLANAARLANAAAGLAVAKKGTAQVSSDDLRKFLLSRPHFEIHSKIFADLKHAEAVTRGWKSDGLVVGFTNGCFDLLHQGHIALLAEARSRCDRLIVGLNSDVSVKRLKGSTRPIQDETSRATVLAALSFVDGVIMFDQTTPLELIALIRPDVLIKGADYTLDQVVGRDIVEAYGGKVSLVEIVPGVSTTRIVATIRGKE